jgi:hypothetical protein
MLDPHFHFHRIPNWAWGCSIVLLVFLTIPEARQRVVEYVTRSLSVTPASPDIAGTWEASNGVIIQIWPDGEGAYRLTATNPRTHIQSQGTVKVQGRRFSSVFWSSNSGNGSGKGTILGDGGEMTGRFWDPAAGDYELTLWKR